MGLRWEGRASRAGSSGILFGVRDIFERSSFWIEPAKMAVYTAIAISGWLARRLLLWRSTHWPIVQGQVQYLSGAEHGFRVTYSYSVNGEYYSGTLPVRKSRALRNEDDLRAVLPVGSSIDVRYSIDKPDVSAAVFPEICSNGGFPIRV